MDITMSATWVLVVVVLSAAISQAVNFLIRKIKSSTELIKCIILCEAQIVQLRSKLELYDDKTISSIVLDDENEDESTILAKIATIIHQVKVQNRILTFLLSENYLSLLNSVLTKILIYQGKLDVLKIFTTNPSIIQRKSNNEHDLNLDKSNENKEQIHLDFKLFEKNHSHLSGEQLYKLGRKFRQGIGVARDGQKAYLCFKMSAEYGDMDGKTGLATCYLDGTGVRKDVDRAFQDLKNLSDKGHTKAIVNLGICYFNGFGVVKNVAQAFSAFQMAARNGDAQAKCNIGSFYLHGCFVNKDMKKAVKLFREASESNNADAHYNLGRCYQNGEGVKKNVVKAIQSYKKAANLHSPLALCTLAHCYETGYGTDKDMDKAKDLFKQAADKGNPYAKERIEQSLNASQVRPAYKDSSKKGWLQDMPGEL